MFAPNAVTGSSALSGVSVVIASRIYLPEPGAASLRLAALARTLRDAGAEVTVMTTTPPSAYGESVPDHASVAVKRARVLRDRYGYVRGYLQYMSFDIPLFFRLLFTRTFDVVVVEPPPTTGAIVRLVCALRRKPYVYYAADLWADAVRATGAPGFVARAVRALERFAMRKARAVLSVSESVSDRVTVLDSRVAPVTIGNGVDTKVFSPDGSSHDTESGYLLYVGTSSEVHGATIFLDAFAQVVERLPSARLVFVGQGSDRQSLEDSAVGLPQGAVTFVSRVSPEEAARWIRGACATLASVKPGAYPIGFPTKIYASVSCGVPVIYAGDGVGREFAQVHDIGWPVGYIASEVEQAMIEALDGQFRLSNGDRLAQVAVKEVSLNAVALRAASAIGEVVFRSRKVVGAE